MCNHRITYTIPIIFIYDLCGSFSLELVKISHITFNMHYLLMWQKYKPQRWEEVVTVYVSVMVNVSMKTLPWPILCVNMFKEGVFVL